MVSATTDCYEQFTHSNTISRKHTLKGKIRAGRWQCQTGTKDPKTTQGVAQSFGMSGKSLSATFACNSVESASGYCA
eukprot:6311111-Amphidinium_carterae.1